MVKRQINQEIELYTTPGKKNKEKAKFARKREEDFLTFLVYFQKKARIFSLFGELIFEQRK
jgi:hypothetical protein